MEGIKYRVELSRIKLSGIAKPETTPFFIKAELGGHYRETERVRRCCTSIDFPAKLSFEVPFATGDDPSSKLNLLIKVKMERQRYYLWSRKLGEVSRDLSQYLPVAPILSTQHDIDETFPTWKFHALVRVSALPPVPELASSRSPLASTQSGSAPAMGTLASSGSFLPIDNAENPLRGGKFHGSTESGSGSGSASGNGHIPGTVRHRMSPVFVREDVEKKVQHLETIFEEGVEIADLKDPLIDMTCAIGNLEAKVESLEANMQERFEDVRDRLDKLNERFTNAFGDGGESITRKLELFALNYAEKQWPDLPGKFEHSKLIDTKKENGQKEEIDVYYEHEEKYIVIECTLQLVTKEKITQCANKRDIVKQEAEKKKAFEDEKEVERAKEKAQGQEGEVAETGIVVDAYIFTLHASVDCEKVARMAGIQLLCCTAKEFLDFNPTAS